MWRETWWFAGRLGRFASRREGDRKRVEDGKMHFLNHFSFLPYSGLLL